MRDETVPTTEPDTPQFLVEAEQEQAVVAKSVESQINDMREYAMRLEYLMRSHHEASLRYRRAAAEIRLFLGDSVAEL